MPSRILQRLVSRGIGKVGHCPMLDNYVLEEQAFPSRERGRVFEPESHGARPVECSTVKDCTRDRRVVARACSCYRRCGSDITSRASFTTHFFASFFSAAAAA